MRGLRWIACLALYASSAQAIVVESGLYANERTPGLAMYLDVQNGRAAAVVYAFDRDSGAPQVFTASAPLAHGIEGTGLLEPPPWGTEGYFPLHYFHAELFSVRNGQTLTQPNVERRAESTKVGSISVIFPYAQMAWAYIALDDESRRSDFILHRFNYGFQRISNDEGDTLLVDLKGQWVFVNQLDSRAQPRRFDFTESTPAELGPVGRQEGFNVIFRDPSRSAELRCSTSPPGSSGSTRSPEKKIGCELFENGANLYAFDWMDIGLDRMQGYVGVLAPASDNPIRRPETIIGLRVVTPSPNGAGAR